MKSILSSVASNSRMLNYFSGLLMNATNRVSKRTQKALAAYKNFHFEKCHKCGRRETLYKLSGEKYGCSHCYSVPKKSRRERRQKVATIAISDQAVSGK